ncbi:MAG: bifunctional ornithine acetyltransferase/N-acetylglutamate synthase, partial [Candidatus Eremiobacterota bacterium]
MIETIEGNATTPAGFLAASVHCGIKRKREDLALLLSEVPAATAGMFTTNRVKAPPVKYTREVVKGGIARAIVVNSGNANACTGEQGYRDACEMGSLTARVLGLPPHHVLVCSTGVIGQTLPMDRVREGIWALPENLTRDGSKAARAIMTTDAFEKTTAVRVSHNGRTYHIGGMAKGAGMIQPNMATTLGFFTTDAPVDPLDLQVALRAAIERSFNSISVDGDTSTNDCVLALANGMAGGDPLQGEELEVFLQALTRV